MGMRSTLARSLTRRVIEAVSNTMRDLMTAFGRSLRDIDRVPAFDIHPSRG